MMDKCIVFFSLVIVFAVCFQTCFADNDVSIAKLVARIDALELQGKHQQALLNEQKEKLLQQEVTIKMLLDWKEEQLRNQPSQQQTDTGEPGVKDQLNVENISSGDNASGIDKQVVKKPTEMANRRTMLSSEAGRHSRIVLGEGSVAFHAVITKGDSTPMGIGQKILFDHVNVNIGGGYHNLHGLFIAPLPGLYIFSTSVMSHNNEDLDVALVKNGVTLAAAYAASTTSTLDQGSVTVVVQVAAGDEIWVQLRYDNSKIIWGDYYSSFMGCLITPL